MKSSEANDGVRPADGRSGGELTIGELARSFGLATHVLRHWESVGVLVPARRSGGQRRYTDDQRCRVALVLRAQRAGMSLARIREALDAPDQQALRDLLSAHLDELARRMEQLREAMEMLEHSMACRHPNTVECPRARELLENTTAVCTGEAHTGGTGREKGPGPLRGAVSG
ncbi:helix-turn-helix domain-containing protein [Nocardiopsis ganjiahuensis]|uniref:helix-turn-helix domain-containing protein n=1 Tax=Nocardiopsis ganjiahuensis TaxID=239984 RepID=UPI000A06A7D9|nr:MerR family transcriptional regulator [Nocardiopsis ganjiahuensis]